MVSVKKVFAASMGVKGITLKEFSRVYEKVEALGVRMSRRRYVKVAVMYAIEGMGKQVFAAEHVRDAANEVLNTRLHINVHEAASVIGMFCRKGYLELVDDRRSSNHRSTWRVASQP